MLVCHVPITAAMAIYFEIKIYLIVVVIVRSVVCASLASIMASMEFVVLLSVSH